MTAPASSAMETSPYPATQIRVDDVTLSRGGIELTRGLSLTLEPGDALFLVGRNGAGKTTLLRAMAGLMRPDAGEIRLGSEGAADAARELVGWLGHTDGLKPSETVRKALRFWTELHGQPRTAIMPVLRLLATDHLIDRPGGRLSRGQQRRIGLARVALSERPIWLLDEPAGPLDGKGRERLADLVADHRARGGIVVAATHQALDWPGAQTLEMGAMG